jgi:hypothetical protein
MTPIGSAALATALFLVIGCNEAPAPSYIERLTGACAKACEPRPVKRVSSALFTDTCECEISAASADAGRR